MLPNKKADQIRGTSQQNYYILWDHGQEIVLILWRIWEQESSKLLGKKNEVNSYALKKEAHKNKTYIYMTLGFEDPAVIPSM